jgi:metallo-beta-lactamase family protein
MRVHFLGAAQQVTGSRYYLEAAGLKLVIDCGMFQERAYVKRNWQASVVPPDEIDAVLLTHAHLDHSGLLPRLVGEGYRGPIYCTPPSRDLAEIILYDAAHIQEEDAAFKAKRHRREGRKGRFPAEPLYRTEDAKETLPLFRTIGYNAELDLGNGVTAMFHDAGHILGSAMLELRLPTPSGQRVMIFSGDIGQWDKPIIRDPTLLTSADYVVMESTYGDRNHRDSGDVEDQLETLINEAVAAGGNVVIPTFAVERAQELMYHVGRLIRAKRIPRLMVFLDSPMAANVTDVFRDHRAEMDEETQAMIDSGELPLQYPGLNVVRSRTKSKAINRIGGSCIIMASSGMCTAGRIKHHLAHNVGRPQSTIIFVGYQARGTLGHELSSGAKQVRIHGARHNVKARVAHLHGLSAHGDCNDLMRWLGHFNPAPKRVFLTHGEKESAEALAAIIRKNTPCDVDVPAYGSAVELD